MPMGILNRKNKVSETSVIIISYCIIIIIIIIIIINAC